MSLDEGRQKSRRRVCSADVQGCDVCAAVLSAAAKAVREFSRKMELVADNRDQEHEEKVLMNA